MDKNGVRIISLEAAEIYAQIAENKDKGYVLPAKKSKEYFELFKNVLDYSLDAIELEKAYKKKYRHEFTFEDEYKNKYTLAVINLKFKSVFKNKEGEKKKNLKELRLDFYRDGFILDGIKYVRYKRSAGSSRSGKCLFIDEKLLKPMEKWGECGLNKKNGDLASWEAYKALSLSSLEDIINIPLDGILFIQDCESKFLEEVVSVRVEDKKKTNEATEKVSKKEKDGGLTAKTEKANIENTIWDGESLLDDSLFIGEYAERHMLLLRNSFFKSCGFRTKLQQWFKDKNITLGDLKKRGFITLATDIEQIVMVTTPSSMKFLKFMKGGLSERNVRKWAEQVGSGFGVVKYDKRTRFFGGDMVQSSYQFINTLGFTQEQAEELLKPSKKYLETIRDDFDFMRYHFTHAYKREKVDEDEDEEISDGLAERSDVIFALMQRNYDFKDTRLYYNFRNKVVEDQKKRLKKGHILLRGTNATLFGNGPEMLLALSGEFDLRSTKNAPIALQQGEVACAKFQDGEKLVGARSPHVTMGNVYCVTNNLNHDLWKYFDLGENIVCVNAIKENIQQRLNGCDYDSDTMLITNDKLVVETAFKQKDFFKVPVCDIPKVKVGPEEFASNDSLEKLLDLDYNTSQNKVGEIINLSQILNSIFWDRLHSGCFDGEQQKDIYGDICKLAVLSGIEIDKVKRAYEVDVYEEIDAIANEYRPVVDEKLNEKPVHKYSPYAYCPQREACAKKDCPIEARSKKACAKKSCPIKNCSKKDCPTKNCFRFPNFFKGDNQERYYAFYNAPMEYVYESAEAIDFRAGREGHRQYKPISAMLRKPSPKSVSTVYDHAKRICEICEYYEKELNGYYAQLRLTKEEDEKELIYERIKRAKGERNTKVSRELTEEYVLFLVLKEWDNGDEQGENWHLYAPLLENEMFKNMLDDSKEERPKITKKTDGEIDVYGLKFTKI